jgi:hypothetical protein
MWYFEVRDPYGVFAVPKYDEHFAAVRGIVQSLVREVCQNSADAAADDKPVDLRFRFGTIDRKKFHPYVADLRPHLCPFPELLNSIDRSGPVRFLVIEDFETTGLTGAYQPDYEGESNFINFWHRYGESEKKAEKGGRHGLGKSTIASSSSARFFFGVTYRLSDKKLILHGQASLKQHQIEGKSAIYDAYGLYYAQDTKKRPVPIIDTAASKFLHDFALERERSPGLSLVIPYPDPDLDEQSLVTAAIENCFHQILSGQLVVRVNDTILSRDTVADRSDGSGLQHLMSAIKLSSMVAGSAQPKVFLPIDDRLDERLSENHFRNSDVVEMHNLWAAGEIVCVRLPVKIMPRNRPAQTGSVMLYIRREPNPGLMRETFVRGRVSIPVRSMTDGANCVALLVADVGIASTFLGDSEPPAHDRWLLVRLKGQYRRPELALNRIKYALRDLLSLLDAGEQDRPIKDALTELLWVSPSSDEEEEDEAAHRRTKTPEVKLPPGFAHPDVSLPLPPPNPHQLRRISGGFAYSYKPTEEIVTEAARILIAYRRRKKPGKKRKYQDFDLNGDSIELVTEGTARIDVSEDANAIILQDIHPNFELKVTGFDENRDLELRLTTE